MFEFIMGHHPFIRTEEDWRKTPDEQKLLMQLKARDKVSLDKPRINVPEHVRSLIREMMEPTLALRPTVTRCLEFLTIDDTQM